MRVKFFFSKEQHGRMDTGHPAVVTRLHIVQPILSIFHFLQVQYRKFLNEIKI